MSATNSPHALAATQAQLPRARMLGWIGLGAIAIIASLSEFVASAPAGMIGAGPVLQPPSPGFAFGTDALGRDMLSETLRALNVTVTSALPAAIVTLVFGSSFGFAAARLPAAMGALLRAVIGVFVSVPAFLLAIVITELSGRGWYCAAAGLSAAPLAFVRAYGRCRTLRLAPHVRFARLSGLTPMALFRRDLAYELHDALAPSAARALASVALIISIVSFFGFGATPPHDDLGSMIAAARQSYLHAYWTAAFPALALLSLVLFARLAAGGESGEQP